MEKWQESEELAERLLEQFEGVLKGVLYHLNIMNRHADYEDYLQEGRLWILEVYQTKGGNPFEPPEKYWYVGYIRRGYQWRVLRALSMANRRLYEEQRAMMVSYRTRSDWYRRHSMVDPCALADFIQTELKPQTHRQRQLVDYLAQGVPKDVIVHQLYHGSSRDYQLEMRRLRRHQVALKKRRKKP